MNASRFILHCLLVLTLLVIVAGSTMGQSVTNTGTWTNTGSLTLTNFTNDGGSASFTNTVSGSLRVKGALNTTQNGANPQNFDVTTGDVRYVGAGAQSITHQVKNNTYNSISTTGTGVGGTKTLTGGITISGSVTSDGSGVTISTGTNTLTVTGGGNPIQSANTGTFSFTSGTVNYGGAAQNVFGTDYGTLGVTAAGAKTIQSSFAVNTALNLSGGNLQINGNTLTIAGSITTTSGTLEGGVTSNLTFSNSGNATLPSVTNGLGTLVINRSGVTDVVTLGGDLTVQNALTLTDGDFNVASTRTLTLNNTVSATSGTLSSATDGTVDYNQASDGQTVLATNYGSLTFSNFNKTLPSANLGIAGDFTPGSASGHTVTGNTISFNGPAQDIPPFNSLAGYNNLTTAGGAVIKTVIGNVVVSGNFVNGSDVTTTVGTNFLSIAGTRTQGNASSRIQFAGAGNGVIFTSGIVEYNGADQTITGSATPAANFYATLVLSNSGTKSVSGAASIVRTTGTLSVNSGIGLSVASDGDLRVEGDLNNGGSVTNAGTITVGI